MAKGVYIGVNGKARKVKKMYAGVEDRYTLLDYIQSSGTQYIDTGFIPNQNTKIEMRVQTTQARACRDRRHRPELGIKGIWHLGKRRRLWLGDQFKCCPVRRKPGHCGPGQK